MLQDNLMVIAVGSQDRSVSLWSSKNPKPFLLIKNIFNQPILDMFWDEKTLFVCSYDGFIKKLIFNDLELGLDSENFELFSEEKVQIPYSKINLDISENGIESYLDNYKNFVSVTEDEYKDFVESNIFNNKKKESELLNTFSEGSQSKNEKKLSNRFNETKQINKNETINLNSFAEKIKNSFENMQSVFSYEIKNKKKTVKPNLSDSNISKKEIKTKNLLSENQNNQKSIFIKDEITSNKNKTEKKRIKPLLIAPLTKENNVIIDKSRDCFFLFKSEKEDKIKNFPEIENDLVFKVKEFTVNILNEEKSKITVKRGTKDFYKLFYDRISHFCGNEFYICFVINNEAFDSLVIYHLDTGILAYPIITIRKIITIDILKYSLLILKGDSSFQIIDLKKGKEILCGKLPANTNLINIKLHEKYFILAYYENNIFFYDKNLKLWLKKDHQFNTILLSDKNENENFDDSSEFDETLNKLEYKFKVKESIEDVLMMVKTAQKMVKFGLKLSNIDDYTLNKFLYIFKTLCQYQQKREVIKLLEELNANCILQPFVIDAIEYLNLKNS
ncbi:hypothetical protein GVAV_001945 [Gurleya vavrai]